MRRLLFVGWLAVTIRSEILDRIAITVGRQAVTERQVDEEIRVAAFLNRASVSLNSAERKSAAQRIIEQLLVQREMEVSHYPLPERAEMDRYAADVKESMGGPQSFEAALRADDLNEDVLREHLGLQLTLLRFIEFRFKPEVNISEQAIREAYAKETEESRTSRSGSPRPLAEERDEIQQTLAAQQTDELLDSWLKRNREMVNVVYLDRTLQ